MMMMMMISMIMILTLAREVKFLPRLPAFQLLSMREQNIPKYRIVGTDFRLRVNGLERGRSFNDILFQLATTFGELLEHLLHSVEN
jgi:hypothetical protein